MREWGKDDNDMRRRGSRKNKLSGGTRESEELHSWEEHKHLRGVSGGEKREEMQHPCLLHASIFSPRRTFTYHLKII